MKDQESARRSPFDPPRAEMDAIGAAALDFVIDFIEGRESAPAQGLADGHELAHALRGPPPEEGVDFTQLLDVVAKAAGRAYETAGPGYLAYIPGGGLFSAAIGDLLACVTNRFVNLSAPAPALVQLEANVVRWLCNIFGFPPESQGILTSGGSLANFSAVVAARVAKLSEDFLRGAIYVTEHVHHSITKSARLAGFPASSIRMVACDRYMRLDTDALRSAIAEDRAAGLEPFMAIGNAGTTNTGAVDPLDDLADICRDEGLWFHVDAAYGGFFQLTEIGRRRLHGIERADSITLDPHKGMFLPYGTGSLLVRDRESLKAAHRGGALYLPDASTDPELPDFADYSPELSRDFRGLRVWLPLHLHGVAAFRAALEEKLTLTRRIYDALVEVPSLDVPWEPDLSIVAFRPREGGNDAARRLLAAINASGRIFLSGTTIGDDVYVRVCVLSHRTRAPRVDEAIEIIAKAAANL